MNRRLFLTSVAGAVAGTFAGCELTRQSKPKRDPDYVSRPMLADDSRKFVPKAWSPTLIESHNPNGVRI